MAKPAASTARRRYASPSRTGRVTTPSCGRAKNTRGLIIRLESTSPTRGASMAPRFDGPRPQTCARGGTIERDRQTRRRGEGDATGNRHIQNHCTFTGFDFASISIHFTSLHLSRWRDRKGRARRGTRRGQRGGHVGRARTQRPCAKFTTKWRKKTTTLKRGHGGEIRRRIREAKSAKNERNSTWAAAGARSQAVRGGDGGGDRRGRPLRKPA